MVESRKPTAFRPYSDNLRIFFIPFRMACAREGYTFACHTPNVSSAFSSR